MATLSGIITPTNLVTATSTTTLTNKTLGATTATGTQTLSSTAINTARSNVAQHATTMDFWAAAVGNVLDGTGAAVTITAIANAPQAGASRDFYPLTGTILTQDATFDIDGAVTRTSAAGEVWTFVAKSVNTYRVFVRKADGTAVVSGASGANPSATIGTAAVNGSASTFLRSDGAPAFGNLTGAVTSTGMATVLGSFTSANLATALTDETGSGANVFATSPTLVTPVLGTPSSGTLSSCTVDGTNKVGYQNIPLSGIKTASYTLVAGDVGKFVELGTSGTIVVPASIFATGDAISIFNNTSASISCTCSAVTTVYKGGTDADIASFSVTTRGVATILFITATVAVVTGNLA